MHDVKITDTLPEGLSYVETGAIQVSISGASSGTTIESVTPTVSNVAVSSEDKRKIALDLGDKLESGYTASFILNTVVTDPAVYANNSTNNKYTNSVVLDSTEANQSTTATATVNSEVIKKENTSNYKYNTREIDWKITVNKNKMDMKSPVVTDKLAEKGLELVGGTVKVNGTPLTNNTSEASYYTYSNGVMVIYLADISRSEGDSAKKEITYTTKVMESYEGLQKNHANVIENGASLKTTEYTTAVNVTDNIGFTNTLVGKTAKVDKNTNRVTYTVTFNQAQILVPAKLVIQDTMAKCFQLDTSSVKLYRGKVAVGDGKVTSSGTLETGYQVSAVKTDAGTIMKVTMPDRSDNHNAYVLEYKALLIDETGPFTNKVQVGGYSNDNDSAALNELQAGDFASGFTTGLRRAIVTKQSPTGEKLQGAVFALKSGGVTLTTGTTDDTGTVTFMGLTKDQEYVIEEITPPAGYMLAENSEWTFKGPENGGIDGAAKQTFINKKAPAPTTSTPNGGGSSSGGSGGSSSSTTTPAATPTKPGTTRSVESRTPRTVMVPGIAEPVTETEIITELTNVYVQPETPEKAQTEEQLRQKISTILAIDPHFFDDASEEVRAYVRNLMQQGNTEMAAGLPKTGGFWGSGIMYILGSVLIVLGVMGFMKSGKKSGISKEEK